MSDRKARLTVTVDTYLADYAERLVEAGRAESVSAVVNGALRLQEQQDRDDAAYLRELAAKADPERVARMKARVDAQLAQVPGFVFAGR